MPRLRLVLAVTLLLATPPLATRARAAESDHIDHTHQLVRIGNTSLHPQVLTIGVGEAFGWLNYASQIATVSFDAAVADQMLCTERSSFRLAGKNIESGDIQARQFVSLCSLAKGTYPYRVTLRAGAGGSGAAPGRALEGTLVVE